MSAEPAIEVNGVGKRYAVGQQEQYLALRDIIARAPKQAARRFMRVDRPEPPVFWALDDVSMSIEPGEVVGLVGRNGAGKSTLLKLLSSITRPTRGDVRVRGRVGTLLEVGSGFHPELTGAENIYLNGAILGMRRAEIERNFDQIVEFSGISTYLDTPVKRYSSGMYMRLAFAVAAHLDTEILLVDEVLAVGDSEFQRRCIGRMRELSQGEGRTVVFVSHNDAAIRQLCPRSVWLADGSVAGDGPTSNVLDRYLDAQFRDEALGQWIDMRGAVRTGSGEVVVTDVRVRMPDGRDAQVIEPGDPLRVQLRLHVKEGVHVGSAAIYLATLGGTKLVSGGTGPEDPVLELAPGISTIEIVIDALPLNAGRYSCSLWLARPTGARRKFGLFDHVEDAFDVVVTAPTDSTAKPEGLVAVSSHLELQPEDTA